jgi:hypothetical protein
MGGAGKRRGDWRKYMSIKIDRIQDDIVRNFAEKLYALLAKNITYCDTNLYASDNSDGGFVVAFTSLDKENYKIIKWGLVPSDLYCVKDKDIYLEYLVAMLNEFAKEHFFMQNQEQCGSL